MATIRFSDEDRDDRGFVTVPAPAPSESRSLADLLPPASAARLAPAKQPIRRSELISSGVAVLLACGVLLYLAGSRPASAPQAVPAPPHTRGDGVATPSPIPAAAPAVAGRLLIAFGAPDGNPLGAIESTRAITPTAHYGDAWIQADVQGSGRIWLRASDAPDLAITGPDLAPRPTATARPAVPPTPEPQPPCLTAGTGARLVTVCDWGDLEALAKATWLITYGGNPGIVTTPTPQEWNTP
ncbi:MAG: hypothetical protein M3R61_01460 [Chloroflexota bacterium]|nr:hypothetical protein [Chloroflexota bacterium]